MTELTAVPLTPLRDYHPLRATFLLPQPVIRTGWKVYESAAAASGHRGVAALFRIPGVQIVTLHRNSVKLLRDPEVSWEDIVPAAQEVLRQEFLGHEPLEAA
ncbi:MAG: hypothetical protein EYC70_03535 [Planctomycetota bacterium]|nr:MAG: hypothetical protein EYC70_03535 [Planctomycetota bacterium]